MVVHADLRLLGTYQQANPTGNFEFRNFDRRVLRNTPARFRTRVTIEHIIPSLWIDYKSSTVKQYFKEGRDLRAETTINKTRDCEIGCRHGFASLA